MTNKLFLSLQQQAAAAVTRATLGSLASRLCRYKVLALPQLSDTLLYWREVHEMMKMKVRRQRRRDIFRSVQSSSSIDCQTVTVSGVSVDVTDESEF